MLGRQSALALMLTGLVLFGIAASLAWNVINT